MKNFLPFQIAKRYTRHKKRRNVIHIITRISIFGILISTTALVILLSAFNGIEYVVKQMYSEFDASITIRSAKGKTFDSTTFPYEKLKKNPSIYNYSQAIEEIVIIKHDQKWSNANLIAVQPSFLQMSNMENHLLAGEAKIDEKGVPFTILGAGLMDKVDTYVYELPNEYQFLDIYFPLRTAKMKIGSDPFNNELIRIAGSYNFNRDVNFETLIVPLKFAQKGLAYNQDISCIYVHVPKENKITAVQNQLKKELGEDWIVKTQFEKNELIYKTSKTEKMIVIGILVFVFIISAFNLMTALVMSILEKKKDIFTLYSIGMTKSAVFKIYFFNGMIISLKGIFWGLLLGYAICFAQLYFGLIEMPNMVGGIFPMQVHFVDGLLIFGIVFTLSLLTSSLPVKYILGKLHRERE